MSNLATAVEQEVTTEELPGAQLGELPPNNYPLHTEWRYRCEVYDQVPEQPSDSDAEASETIRPL